MKKAKFTDDKYEPYFGWCDVEGCDKEGCSGGNAWRRSGYWTVCYMHANDFAENKPQPEMKQKSIDRENSRNKTTGYLPNTTQRDITNNFCNCPDDKFVDMIRCCGNCGKRITKE